MATGNKIPSMVGKRRNKRVLLCAEAMQESGQNPFINLIRLAIKAEKGGDIPTASANWRYLGDFIDAKRKPIDPDEKDELAKRSATLDELRKIKTAILAGTVAAIEEQTVIENELPVIEQAQDLV